MLTRSPHTARNANDMYVGGAHLKESSILRPNLMMNLVSSEKLHGFEIICPFRGV